MPSFKIKPVFFLYLSILTFPACQKNNPDKQERSVSQETNAPATTLFTLLPAEKTRVSFNNAFTDGVYANILMYQYFYNGGGVAVGDINNDGLQDLYFSGNMTPNHLYLNKGNMQFENITDQAGVAGKRNTWIFFLQRRIPNRTKKSIYSTGY